MKRKPIVTLSSLAVVGIAAAIVGTATTPAHAAAVSSTNATTISVTGSADEKVSPDVAQVGAGVVAKAKTAALAQQQNNQAMNKVMATLKAAGIQAGDIQTQWYNLQPDYGQPKNGQQNIVGFEADDNINVTVRKLSQVGPVIDALVKAGANQINNVNYMVSNPSAIQKKLESSALDDAHTQAEAIAQKLGLTITGVQSVDTNQNGGGPIVEMKYMQASAASTATVLSPGTQDISTSVSVVYTAK